MTWEVKYDKKKGEATATFTGPGLIYEITRAVDLSKKEAFVSEVSSELKKYQDEDLVQEKTVAVEIEALLNAKG